MTTYTAISNGQVDADSPIDAPLMQALRDNPLSIREMATGAPPLASAWHPYDMATIGDGTTGTFYTGSGGVMNVATPNFENGYEYLVIFDGIDPIAGSQNFWIEFYKQTDAAYTATQAIISTTTANPHYGALYIPYPRWSTRRTFEAKWLFSLWDTNGAITGTDAQVDDSTGQPCLGVRFSCSGNISGGTLKLWRRRELFTG